MDTMDTPACACVGLGQSSRCHEGILLVRVRKVLQICMSYVTRLRVSRKLPYTQLSSGVHFLEVVRAWWNYWGVVGTCTPRRGMRRRGGEMPRRRGGLVCMESVHVYRLVRVNDGLAKTLKPYNSIISYRPVHTRMYA